MAEIYKTNDGQTFSDRGAAQNHANNLAALKASGDALNDSENKDFYSILAFLNKATELFNEGFLCFKAENWKGAVDAYTKGINYMESPEWEANKQRFQNYCKRGYMAEKAFGTNSRWGDRRTEQMEKFYHDLKSELADSYFYRGMAKVNIGGGDPTANRDFRMKEKLEKELNGTSSNSSSSRSTYSAEPRDAKELFEKAVELSTYPNNDDDKAIELFTKVISLLPNDDKSYAGRGGCYGVIGELDKSVEDYSKAIALNPTEPQYYASRRYFYPWLGEIEKAVADAEKEIELSGKEEAARIYDSLANNIEKATGNTDQAIVYYKKSADHGGFKEYTKEALARLGVQYTPQPPAPQPAAPAPAPQSSGDSIFCTNCGTKLPGDARFCGNCGTPTQAAAAPQQSTPTGGAKPRVRATGVGTTCLTPVAEATTGTLNELGIPWQRGDIYLKPASNEIQGVGAVAEITDDMGVRILFDTNQATALYIAGVMDKEEKFSTLDDLAQALIKEFTNMIACQIVIKLNALGFTFKPDDADPVIFTGSTIESRIDYGDTQAIVFPFLLGDNGKIEINIVGYEL